MKVLVTGATGFIGQFVCLELIQKGHEVFIITRDAKKAKQTLALPVHFLEWQHLKGRDADKIADIAAVIHLAGESVGTLWTPERKKNILLSRLKTTSELLQALEPAIQNQKLKVIASASAIGIYGDRHDEELTEEKVRQQEPGFLPEVCRQWESSLALASSAETVRKVFLRIGLVLGSNGGVLQRLESLSRLNVLSPLDGAQWLSWIHIHDLARLFVFAIENPTVEGPLNAVAPHPVTNKDFTLALNAQTKKWTLPSVPGFLLSWIPQLQELLLASQRVSNQKVQQLGFLYEYADLSLALKEAVGPDRKIKQIQWFDLPVEELFHFFSDEKNLERITPKHLRFKVLKKSTANVEQGTLIEYRLRLHGIPFGWRTLIDKWEPNQSFVDRQLRGPYKTWEHEHKFVPLKRGTLMIDEVHYQLPLGFVGDVVAEAWVKDEVTEIFSYRKKVIADLLDKSLS